MVLIISWLSLDANSRIIHERLNYIHWCTKHDKIVYAHLPIYVRHKCIYMNFYPESALKIHAHFPFLSIHLQCAHRQFRIIAFVIVDVYRYSMQRNTTHPLRLNDQTFVLPSCVIPSDNIVMSIVSDRVTDSWKHVVNIICTTHANWHQLRKRKRLLYCVENLTEQNLSIL